MKLYSDEQEENIFIGKKAREMLRSKLITREQYEQLRSRSGHGLKTTGFFFRLIYFLFSCLFLAAIFFFFVQLFNIRNSFILSMVFFLFGGGAYWLAEWLVTEKRLYRFGIEEGFALGASFLFSMGLASGLAPFHLSFELVSSIRCLASAAIYFWYYRRFGFLYAAFLSISFLASLPLQLHFSEMSERLSLLALFGALFYLNIKADQRSGFEYQKENDQNIRSILIIGLYFAINAALPGLFHISTSLPPLFYWACFALTFIVPGLVLFFGAVNKNRVFIDTGLITSIISLCTIKLFFSQPYQAWDPIILGLVLIASAFGIKHLIDRGRLPGYTANNIMSPESHGLDLFAAGAMAANPALSHGSPQAFSGGSSGGAGASRQF